jgi:peptide/nickel transport system substrate-binding protein
MRLTEPALSQRAVRVLLVAVLGALAFSVAINGASGRAAGAPTLVVDNSFALDTTDPQRAYDPTSVIIDRAIYDTLFTYRSNDLKRPIPLLVQSWTSEHARRFTFRLRRDVHFADGTPLTSADVVFSLRRLVNLKDNPSYLLAGFTISARDKYTVVITSKSPAPDLPSILTVIGIVNSKLAEEHGGTDALDAATKDTAEKWFNSSASAGAGSGPYELQSYGQTSQVVLRANPNYWGANRPAFERIVLRNMLATAQLLNIQRGGHQIALDLSADQAQTLKRKQGLRVTLQPSVWVFYAFSNDNPRISSVTSNKRFQEALRYALGYSGLVSVAGPGATQAPGVIPSMILGALPRSAAARTDLAKARSALAASGVGSTRVTLAYPNDITINGVPFTTLAQKAQAQLRAAGFNVDLAGSPIDVFQPSFRAGKIALGLWAYAFVYPDPSSYDVFEPGNLIALHAGWQAGSDPAVEKLAAKARLATTPAARGFLYQKIQLGMNARSPFVPLVEPAQAFAATTDLSGAAFSGVYLVDLTRISPK